MTASSAAEPDTALIDRLCQQRQARLVETHISWVLLDGQEAWKIKKPLRLPFLDASTLPLRQKLCEEELRLNRRLAPSLYLDVTPITGTPDAPALGGSGPVIDYAVHMRQFPDGALLNELILPHRNPLAVPHTVPQVTPPVAPPSPAPSRPPLPAQLNDFAQRLAAFHRQADVATADTLYGSSDLVEQTTRDVLHNLADVADEAISVPFTRWLDENAPLLRPMWAERQRRGRIVEGHGDLHLANVVLLDDALTAFDCIEFDPALRWVDPLSDVAFLVMDLMAHQRADLAFRSLNAYLDASGDHAGLPVLRHYLVYRALVRALVTRIKAGKGLAPAGPDYLALAHRLIAPTAPRLLITHGVSGSGKTFVSQGLLEQAGAIRVRSDIERKRLFVAAQPAAQPAVAAPSGSGDLEANPLYSHDRTQATYAHLHDLAQRSLQSGWHTIVDATFLDAGQRHRFRQLAAAQSAPFAILHCEAARTVLEARLITRQHAAQDASDADVTVLNQQLQRDTALGPEETRYALQADTTQPDWAARLTQAWSTMEAPADRA